MKQLLLPAELRRVKIIEQLATNASWVSVEELAETADCSTKTIDKEIKYLENEWKDYFALNVSRKNGVKILPTNVFKLDRVYRRILRNNPNFQFLEKVFFTPFQTADDWKSTLDFSTSSFYRMLSLVDERMKLVFIELDRKTFSLRSKDERFVRFHFANYFEQAYGFEDWPFPNIDRNELFHFILSESKNIAEEELNQEQLLRLCYLFACSLTRMKQGFFLKEDSNFIYSDNMKAFVEGKKEEIEAFVDFEIPDNYQRELSGTLLHFRYAWENKEERVRVREELETYLEKLASENAIELPQESKRSIVLRLMVLYTNFRVFPYPRYSTFKNFKNLSERVYAEFPRFTEKYRECTQSLEKEMNFPWFSLFFDQITTYLFTDWERLEERLEERRRKVKLLVVSSFGRVHGEFIEERIRERKGRAVTIELYEKNLLEIAKVPLMKFMAYDFIVTTDYLFGLPFEKMHMMDLIPNLKQMNALERKITELQLKIHK